MLIRIRFGTTPNVPKNKRIRIRVYKRRAAPRAAALLTARATYRATYRASYRAS
jgi:hypothetical protein